MEKYPEKLMMCVSDDNGCVGAVKIGKIYRIEFRKYPNQYLHQVALGRQIIFVVDVQLWSYLDAFIDIPHGENTNGD